jgi:hypothetical protein
MLNIVLGNQSSVWLYKSALSWLDEKTAQQATLFALWNLGVMRKRLLVAGVMCTGNAEKAP